MIRLLRTVLIGAGIISATVLTVSLAVPDDGQSNASPTAVRSGRPEAQQSARPSAASVFDTGTFTGPEYDPGLTRAPTGSKSQSKLWFHDGTWWAVMLASADAEFRIFAFDPASKRWLDTRTPVDPRHNVRMDVLWDGTKLLVLSAGGTPDSEADAARLTRFSYDTELGRYLLDPDFPVTVTDGGVGAITIARDSAGALWATYVLFNQVTVASTSGEDHRWNAPYALPVEHSTAAADEAAIISFGESVGVMWSNQAETAIYFAVHADGDPIDQWSPTEIAIEEEAIADNHVSLRSMMTPDGPIVAAATKTSKDQARGEGPASPQILVLLRRPDATWVSSMVARVSDHHTRAVLSIEEDARRLHVFATSPFGGGKIFHKVASIDDMLFQPGTGEEFLGTDPNLLSNVSVAKHNLTAETGMVVIATDDQQGHYATRAISLGGEPFPTPRVPIVTGGESVLMHDTFDPWISGNPFAHGWVATEGTAIIERQGEGSIIRLLAGAEAARLCKRFAGDVDAVIRATALVQVDSLGTARSGIMKLRAGGSEVAIIRVLQLGGLDYTSGTGRLEGPLPVPVGTPLRVTVSASPETLQYSANVVVSATGETLLDVSDVPLGVHEAPIDEVCFEASPNSAPGGVLIDEVAVARLE